jgi:hypothetical protein
MVGVGEQTPPAIAQTPPPPSPALAGKATPPMMVEFATPPSNLGVHVDAHHDSEVHFHTLDNLVGGSAAPGLAGRVLNN